MGIPKFFRYISERYPLTSQLIEENKIPEFDNLYIDFNGIIHNCSHPNDEDAHFRLTEEQIFTSIFTYVDHLFGKIKPKKVFFMAVDGVAPRAKMNQQRSRRFRTAKEVKEVRERAERRGEVLPKEKAFDSNCITPGTPFMTRLSTQLRYFVNKKISEDANWREVQVILSGHEVPGEGEHKIMEYIRLSKAQPDYNPNVRHCLYGLDADLIMLGLLSHDPHFCLLREEVKFGPAARKKNSSLEAQNFFLLHLSLLREYLDLEFTAIRDTLPFEYNLERVIDDFVLLAVFVGNDFLPHLPDLHIHENGLEKLFDVYKEVLPRTDGYINESGEINTKRLQLVLDEMARWESEVFEKQNADMNWYKGKQTKHVQAIERARESSALVITTSQQDIFSHFQRFVLSGRDATSASHTRSAQLVLPNTFPARDRRFITTLASDLHLSLSWDEYVDDQNVVIARFPYSAHLPADQNGDTGGDGSEWEDVEEEDIYADEEGMAAVDRVLQKYSKANVVEEEGDFDDRYDRKVQQRMNDWKESYYREKLEFSYSDPKALGDLIFRYVEGLQWVMHYYYSGVASWSWFYDYHYAPRISDLRGVDKMSFSFDLGTPFRPFEQLMGVLPEASKDHIPLAYQDLMYDVNSPLIAFFPTEFEQDLNGKKQDWEAIVKIPFIDHGKLLKVMATREHRLTDEERRRNGFGTSTTFVYDANIDTVYPSSLPGFFPAIHHCHCVMQPFDLPTLDGLHLVEGLCDGVFLGAEALAGFPSLKTLPHTAQLGYHGVNVFQSESKNKSMVVHIDNNFEGVKSSDIAHEMVGKRTYIGWPFLQEGVIAAVSDSHFRYEKGSGPGGQMVAATPHSPPAMGAWARKAERIESIYSKRFAVITGPVEVLLHVRPLKGLKRLDTGAMVKDYEGPAKETEQAVQMSLMEVSSEDPRFMERDAPPLKEEFPDGSKIFFLGEHAYGVAAQVQATTDATLSVILAWFPSERQEVEKLQRTIATRSAARYLPAYRVADQLGISGLALAKVTSSLMALGPDGQKINLGLSLKFEAKSMKVLDYSRKEGRSWEFSDKAIQLLQDYKSSFPELFRKLDARGDDLPLISDIFPNDNPDAKLKELRAWLNSKGIRDFEPVSLFCDRLGTETVKEIEAVTDAFSANKQRASIKKVIVQGIPRQAVLKPAHSAYRLQNQAFALGDRVIMVQDTGGVPLAAKGVVIAVNSTSVDVVWDVPFMSGTTLQNRCSEYRGSTCSFNSCLNLSNPQFIMSTNPKAPIRPPLPPFAPRAGPRPAVGPRGGQPPQAGFRGAGPMHILSNPHRGSAPRGAPISPTRRTHSHSQSQNNAGPSNPSSPVTAEPRRSPTQSRASPHRGHNSERGQHPTHGTLHIRGGFSAGRGGDQIVHASPRGFHSGATRGRGGGGRGGGGRGGFPRGGFRGGRGRGHPNHQQTPEVIS